MSGVTGHELSRDKSKKILSKGEELVFQKNVGFKANRIVLGSNIPTAGL
jgi:hypothetical protein